MWDLPAETGEMFDDPRILYGLLNLGHLQNEHKNLHLFKYRYSNSWALRLDPIITLRQAKACFFYWKNVCWPTIDFLAVSLVIRCLTRKHSNYYKCQKNCREKKPTRNIKVRKKNRFLNYLLGITNSDITITVITSSLWRVREYDKLPNPCLVASFDL